MLSYTSTQSQQILREDEHFRMQDKCFYTTQSLTVSNTCTCQPHTKTRTLFCLLWDVIEYNLAYCFCCIVTWQYPEELSQLDMEGGAIATLNIGKHCLPSLLLVMKILFCPFMSWLLVPHFPPEPCASLLLRKSDKSDLLYPCLGRSPNWAMMRGAKTFRKWPFSESTSHRW